jgi:hypothetical protein
MSNSQTAQVSLPGESSTLHKDRYFGIPVDIFIIATIVIVVSVLRLPFILWPHEMNPDESQLLSQAMKFLVDPVPWRGVDGTSGGPLNSYLISFFLLWGIKPGYILAHVLADILVCLQLSVAYRTLLRIASREIAVLGMLPMVFCFGFTSDPDFLHFSSELLPALLLALGFHLFVVMVYCRREGHSSSLSIQLFISGLALGMAPWCKLQALPIAAILTLAVSAYFLLSQDRNMPVRSHLVRFWAGVLLPSVLILAVVAKGGALKDFWSSYILGNMAYAGVFRWPRFIGTLKWVLWLPETKVLTLSLAMAALAALAWLFFIRKRRIDGFSREEMWVLATVASYFFMALFVVCRPANRFPHYAIFLLHPMTYLAVQLISKSFTFLAGGREGRAREMIHVLAGCTAAVLGLYTVVRIIGLHQIPQPPPNASERIAAVIGEMKQTRPIESLSIWGWEPGVYVLTGIPPATRDSIGHFVISLGLSQPYFRQRFIGDLRRAPPDLFVDAVARGAFIWYWKESIGYESDPELKAFIDEHYVLVKELPLTAQAKPVRFFQRLAK